MNSHENVLDLRVSKSPKGSRVGELRDLHVASEVPEVNNVQLSVNMEANKGDLVGSIFGSQ